MSIALSINVSSESTMKVSSELISRTPLLIAECFPPFSFHMYLIGKSAVKFMSDTIDFVLSLLPSSTISHSKFLLLCLHKELKRSGNLSLRLYDGVSIVIFNSIIHPLSFRFYTNIKSIFPSAPQYLHPQSLRQFYL